jgi:hypothetical protein
MDPMKVTYWQAQGNESMRTVYAQELVRTSGIALPFLDNIKYVPNNKVREEAAKLNPNYVTSLDKERKGVATLIYHGRMGQTRSTLLLTDAFFLPPYLDICRRSPLADIHAVHRTSLAVHEGTHSNDFGKGIEGLPLSLFDLDTLGGMMAFRDASEIHAHTRAIQEIGKIRPGSQYPWVYQRTRIKRAQDYRNDVINLARQNHIPQTLADAILKRFEHVPYIDLSQHFSRPASTLNLPGTFGGSGFQ